MGRYLLILKILVVLWMISVVVECNEKSKRDVHRIIIKERRPRSQKTRHHRHQHHHHDHGHHKHPHHHHGSYEQDHSYEDNSKYYSPENSFEDISAYKSSHEHYKLKPSSSSPPLDFKHESFRDEWTPLLSSDNKVLRHQNENSRKRRKPMLTHHDSKRYNLPLQIDLTTSYPQKLPYPSLFETNNFPIMDNSYNFNQKLIDSNQSPLIKTGIIIKPQLGLMNHHHQAKNVKENIYDVNESIKEDDLDVDEQRNIHSITLSDNNPQLEVTEAEELTEKPEKKEENVKTEKKKPTRGRGRRFRGNN